MNLRFFKPNPLLAQHIDKLWVFESQYGMPADDLKTSVPNGMMKLIIPYKGALFSYLKNQPFYKNPESTISIAGVMETPVVIDGTGELGTIGIEFKPSSAYRFFRFSLKDTTNLVHHTEEIMGKLGYDLQQLIADKPTVEQKISAVEQFLLRLLYASDNSDWVVDYAMHEITTRHGMVNMEELARKIGYSKRYLDMKFADYVGVNPKAMAGIMRFQKFYKEIGLTGTTRFLESDLYEYYYDQAHFIKDFKRFTGYAPRAYTKVKNEFGRIFYQT